jgi:hypothetical protein
VRLRRVCGWLVAGLLLAGVAGAQPVTLDAHAMRQLAYTAVKAGFAADALNFTDALLLRDPEDTTALTIRSQALRALGRTGEARAAARAAWDAASNDPGRFGAAMAMAQALSTDGRRTAAQWWLRRAGQHAPNDRAKAVARRDFGYVRSRNPWDIQITASAAPSSNVNNGSRQDSLTLSGLPFEFEIPAGSQALSGFETGLGLRGSYRFAPTVAGRQTSATFALLGQAVTLSDSAQTAAPDLSGSDFSYAAVEAGLRHRRALDPKAQTVGKLSATAGHNWYGGAPLSDYLQLEAGLDRKLQSGGILSFGLAGDRVRRIDSPAQSSDRIEVSLGYDRDLASGDALSVGVRAARAVSDSPEIGNEAVGLSLGWTRAEPVAGVGLSAGLGVETKLFDQSRYVEGGREDVKLTANLTLTFDKVDYMGFVPVLDLRATRNRSNAALYDTQDLGITLGIRSSF